jgi:drug/metabolite transporter (DMT)-like permease
VNGARLRPLLYLAVAVLFWGSSFVATKTAMQSFSPMAVMWLRMVVASLVFLPIWRRVPRSDRRPGDRRYLLLAVLFVPCLYYLFEGFALRFTSAGQAGAVSAVLPLLVAAAAWPLLGERLSWQSAVRIAVAIAAIAMLSFSGVEQDAAPRPLLGNVLMFGAMLAATGSTLTVKHLSLRYDPWFLTGLQAAVGVVFFAPLAFAAGVPDVAAAPLAAWAALLYLGVVCGLGAFGLYNSALKLLPAHRAALAINAIPVVALLGGWLVLGEALTWTQLVACGLIIGAVVFAEVSGHTATDEQPVY